MKSTSLESGFVCRAADIARLSGKGVVDAEKLLDALTFDEAYDLVSLYMRDALDRGVVADAVALMTALAGRDGGNRVKHAALMQVVAAALIETGDIDGALTGIAGTLRLLSEESDRKDIPFRSVLASLLYDLAILHALRKEYNAAERTIEKAIKLFDSLAKVDPQRYATAHVHALNVATSVYRSRIRQVNLLAHYQVATSTYLAMAGRGASAAVSNLIDSLVKEAETLLKLGKPRDAVRYLERALKYLEKLDGAPASRKIDLSVMLGEALVKSFSTRQKGIHMLEALLADAKKAGYGQAVEKIEYLLDENNTLLMDFLAGWHKIFSRN